MPGTGTGASEKEKENELQLLVLTVPVQASEVAREHGVYVLSPDVRISDPLMLHSYV